MEENKLNDEKDNHPATDHDEFRQRLARGWDAMEAELGKNWNCRYPYFARWVDRPELKISIDADLTNGETSFKVWHIDKSKETLLIDEKTHCTTEEEAHERLDSRIKRWIEKNGDNFLPEN